MATRVLVIDDEEDYRIIITEVLRGAGYDVQAGKDGAEGLELLKKAAAMSTRSRSWVRDLCWTGRCFGNQSRWPPNR